MVRKVFRRVPELLSRVSLDELYTFCRRIGGEIKVSNLGESGVVLTCLLRNGRTFSIRLSSDRDRAVLSIGADGASVDAIFPLSSTELSIVIPRG